MSEKTETTLPRIGRVDPSYARELAEGDMMIQWAIHPAILPGFVAWLDAMQLDFVIVENATETDLPWGIATPRSLGRS